jgi:hypothetical protein
MERMASWDGRDASIRDVAENENRVYWGVLVLAGELGLRSQYGDYATGWMNRAGGSNPGRCQGFFSSPKRPGLLRDSISLPFNGDRCRFSSGGGDCRVIGE